MDNKNEFQPVIVLSIVSILLSVFSIAADAIVQKINNGYNDAFIVLFVSAIALGVLYLASSTTRKQKMLDAINLVTNIVLIIFGSIVAIIEYSNFVQDNNLGIIYGLRFAIGLVVMVAAILKLIYFFISRNSESIRKIYSTITLLTIICISVYLAMFIVHEAMISYGENKVPYIHLFLFVGSILVFTILSYVSPRSNIEEKKEENTEEIEVINQEEKK